MLAADVKHSYETLISPSIAAPSYAPCWTTWPAATWSTSARCASASRRATAELPLVVGGLPVFSRKWGVENGKAKPFDQVVTDIPIGSGPYRIGPVRFGKDITYVRDPNYWARRPERAARHVQLRPHHRKIYKDNTAQLEALKAGEFDLMQFFSAGDWARRLNGKRFDTRRAGQAAVRAQAAGGLPELRAQQPAGQVQGPARARGLDLAMDYEWMNRQLFYGGYKRVQRHFRQHRLRGQRRCRRAEEAGVAGAAAAPSCRRETFGGRCRSRPPRRRPTACAPTCARPRRC